MRAEAYVLSTPGKPLERKSISIGDAGADEVVVEVDACGLCHTDVAFAQGDVAPRHPLPIVLGHEIVGRVAAARGSHERLLGRRVLVPAVLPCGSCRFCLAGRANACPSQRMPGNDIDGGFASHVLLPAAHLVPIDDAPPSVDPRELAVVADAVSTAYQAIRRAGLAEGDMAVVVGAGGVGGYTAQIAHALGARVLAIDVSEKKLAALAGCGGADATLVVAREPPKEVRRRAQDLVRSWSTPSLNHRIFECSGTTEGQAIAFALLGPAATMVQVGYTAKPVEVRLSNLMAFDATLHGTWGCPPDAYPSVLGLVYAGKIKIRPFVEHAPMSRINELIDDMIHHRLEKRIIFDPRT